MNAESCEVKGMKDFWRRTKPLATSALCVLLALYLSPISAMINNAIATHAISRFWIYLFPNGIFFLVMLPALLIGLAAPLFVIVSLFRARVWHEKLTPVVGYVALFWLVNWSGFALAFSGSRMQRTWPHRRAGLQKAANRAQPLINAIEQFEADKGRLPRTLPELVPQYLPRVPQTGMAAYPDYSYRNDGPRDGFFQTYQLRVETGMLMKWDTFNYWPEGDYPPQMYGGRVERIGAWAYVHE